MKRNTETHLVYISCYGAYPFFLLIIHYGFILRVLKNIATWYLFTLWAYYCKLQTSIKSWMQIIGVCKIDVFVIMKCSSQSFIFLD